MSPEESPSTITDTILDEIIVKAFDNDPEAAEAIRQLAVRTDKFLLKTIGRFMTRWPPPITGMAPDEIRGKTREGLIEMLMRRIDYDEERRKHIQALLEYNNRVLERARAAETKLRSYGLAD